jgi:hypothetical protein
MILEEKLGTNLCLLKTPSTAQSLMFPRSRSGSPTPILHLLCALRATARSSLKPPCEPALVKSPCSAALGDRRSPAEAGPLAGDPNDAKLEPRYGVPHRLGGAPDARGVSCQLTTDVGRTERIRLEYGTCRPDCD